ncbi:transcription factor MYB44-like [Primulina tabacum]|uniref:transcription factor MYB44-like n=1 Tax=Primulina tabacum TaxID=48773 RepID=UPI003F5A2EA9
MQQHQQTGGVSAVVSNECHRELKTAGRCCFVMRNGCFELSDENPEADVLKSATTCTNFSRDRGNPRENYSKKPKTGKPKVSSRGHWKTSEDAKLRELVAMHGPQNWNLIAEKLQGRSGWEERRWPQVGEKIQNDISVSSSKKYFAQPSLQVSDEYQETCRFQNSITATPLDTPWMSPIPLAHP